MNGGAFDLSIRQRRLIFRAPMILERRRAVYRDGRFCVQVDHFRMHRHRCPIHISIG